MPHRRIRVSSDVTMVSPSVTRLSVNGVASLARSANALEEARVHKRMNALFSESFNNLTTQPFEHLNTSILSVSRESPKPSKAPRILDTAPVPVSGSKDNVAPVQRL